MVRARSRSFRRTIKGRLRWWPPHHCSVPPLPLATLVRLISELCRNTSPTPIPLTKPAFLSLSLPTNTMCYLPQHNQSPTMLHTRSMFQANHIAHAPVLRSWVAVTTRTCEDLHQHLSAPPGIRVSLLYVHSTTICFHDNSFYVYVLSLYKYSSLLYVFHQFKYQLSNLLLLNSLSSS